MIKDICYLLALVLAVSSQSATRNEPSSPCPNVFKYVNPRVDETPGPGAEKWYGVLTLTTDITLHSLWLNIILDKKADILGNWIGEVSTEDNLDFRIENTKLKLEPSVPLTVRFFIQYKAKTPKPNLRSILFNGREICNADINLSQQYAPKNSTSNPNTDINKTSNFKPSTSTTTMRSTSVPKQSQQLTTTSTSRLGASNNDNKASISSSTWGSTVENIQKTKPTVSQQYNRNNSQSRPESRPVNSQQTDNKITKNEIKEPFFTRGSLASQRTTTTESVQAVYASTVKPWQQNTQEVTTGNNQNVFNSDTQRWSSNIESNSDNIRSEEEQRRRGTLQTTTGTQVWSPTNSGENQQTIYKQQEYTQIRPDDRPTTHRTPPSINYLSHTQSPSGSLVSRYSEEDNNQGISTSNRYQSTSDRRPPGNQVDPVNSNRGKPETDDFEGGIPTFYIPNQGPENTCGKVLTKPPRYLPPGSTTSEGQWPWQTAIYQQQTVDFKYICGGTLVSNRHVITAAHCVAKKKSRREVNKNTLTVYFGKFNLRTSVEGVQIKFVNNIVIHPDYNPMTFSRDLAILELREVVSYTEWVRPICLWPDTETGLRNIIGKSGSVVGWGSEVAGVSKEELVLLEMKVVAQETCINSYSEFYEKFTSDYTYCAGYPVGNTVCQGDSGGGMVFKKGNSWYLRGLVSVSVARSNEYRCDPAHYVVFTDVAKFLPWIEEHID